MQQRHHHNQLTKQEIRRYTIRFWKIVVGCVAFGIILLFSVGLGLFGALPSTSVLENPKSNLASSVISEDGETLGTYYIQNRTPVTYDEISPNVINALVATEDKRFYEHSGIDFSRTLASVFYTLIGRQQGGSTITQQLALNMFSKEGRAKGSKIKRIVQKLQEWILAVKLERSYTKEEIITMYLNTVDWGAYSTFGINSASLTYFRVPPSKLKPDQAALLVGMVNGPGKFSPVRYPENTTRRRNLVLNRMVEKGYLGETEAAEYKAMPLGVKVSPLTTNLGLAPYFRAVLKSEIQKIFEEQSIYKADGTPYDLDRDGLKIYTTINADMQRYAETSQKEYLKILQVQFNQQWHGRDPFKTNPAFEKMLFKAVRNSGRYAELQESGLSDEAIFAEFRKPVKMKIFSWKGDIDTVMRPMDSVKYYKLVLRNSLMSMDPVNGHIKAWVGGNNFEYFKYDQVKVGTRQVGSTAKPFTYAVAIGSNGYSPCYQVLNEPVTLDNGYGEEWHPKAYKPLPGAITLKTALAFSQNYVTAYMMKMVGPTAVKTLIEKMGITSRVEPVNPICLGVFDASVYDMVGAYSAFVNHGIWTAPTYLLKIEDRKGNVIYTGKHPQQKMVLDPSTAYVMTDMLKGVVQRGTGRRIQYEYGLTNPIGGKTGTTQENSDGWFIGITPRLVTGVWTGFEERTVHFASTDQGEGAKSALPVFARYMKRVYADPKLNIPKTDFEPPAGGVNIELNCDAYGGADSVKAADPKIRF
ncbi:transglycosylase domain-containing protein [Hufsiella ginkgonis]|uniref:Penicillin-binding protein n=1 Tax=Hufsiella ginkgonis TaxID=2695274 RepID=A0A7K1Y4E9_9SPHI|nr:transglycosylase domain-containing protein [Hufsiella ginkgonis]MXV17586.1 penicillin-binding protein [Hufsiella ginkgonis]